MDIHQFMEKRPYLVWYVKDIGHLSEESVVEHVLNYGDWDDVQKMIKILGMEKTAKIFYQKSKTKRSNYDSKVKNYFQLYFNKYVRHT